jgi:hypothetical protein
MITSMVRAFRARFGLTRGSIAISLLAWAIAAMPGSSALGQPNTSLITSAAQQLNSLAPQMAPKQTIKIGTYNAATGTFVFALPPTYPANLPPSKRSDAGGDVQPSYIPQINSYNLTYTFDVSNAPANLKMTISVPTTSGKNAVLPISVDTKSGTASVSFNPQSGGIQQVTITDGTNEKVLPAMDAQLAPQLGGFVVPNLLISVIYAPPGSKSTAQYSATSTTGSTVSWGFSETLGNVQTTDMSSTLTAAKKAFGAIPTYGSVMAAVIGIAESETIVTTNQTTTGTTTQTGTSIGVTQGYGTVAGANNFPGNGDLFLILHDVFFMYVTDPSSGKILLTPVGYANATAETVTTLPTVVGAVAAAKMLALDPMQPKAPTVGSALTADVNFPALLNSFTPAAPAQTLYGGRFKLIASVKMDTTSTASVGLQLEQLTSTTTSTVSTQTVMTQVGGLVQSIESNPSDFYGITYSSSSGQWSSHTTAPSIVLCAGQDSEDCWVNCYYDTIFGSIMCLKGAAVTEDDRKAATTGTAKDDKNQPLKNQTATLKIGNTAYQTQTDANGAFSFPIKSLPTGDGTVTVGNLVQKIQSTGQPLTNLALQAGAAGTDIVKPALATPAAGGAATAGGAPQGAGAGQSAAYQVTPIAGAVGRLGKIVFKFPDGSKPGDTRTRVYRSGDTSDVYDAYGNGEVELLPGDFDVTVCGKKIPVKVVAQSQTIVAVGMLTVHAGAQTRVRILDSDNKTVLYDVYGDFQIGLPPGDYNVQVAGQSAPVTVAAGKVTDF